MQYLRSFLILLFGLSVWLHVVHVAAQPLSSNAAINISNKFNIENSISGSAESRVALVIGNSKYKNSPLKNPVNDARDVAVRLRKLGFDVVERNDLQTRQIGSTLREFRMRLRPGAVALVFYAGHGLQIKGENYFPTVDAEIEAEEDVPNQSLSVRQVMDVLDEAKTRLNLVFLDACRNNPYARSFRSAGSGLAKVTSPTGTLISFATRPGSVASDGDGRNGLYTEHLLLAMSQSNLPIELALKRVVSGVKAKSQGKQEPWMEGSIEGDFCFGRCTESSNSVSANEDRETSLWNEVKSSGMRQYLEAYISQYPNGKYLVLSKIELKKLDDKEKAEQERFASNRIHEEQKVAEPNNRIDSDPTHVVPLSGHESGTIAKAQALGTISMGVRDSSGALSYTLGDGRYVGYHVEICQRIIASLQKSIGKKLEIKYVPVTSQNRIPMVQNGSVDIECGSTTNNAARQKDVAFLPTTFVEEVRIAVKASSGITSIVQLGGKNVATTTGTTSVQTLRKNEKANGIDFKEVFGKDHADSFLLLESGRAEAFVMDGAILAGNIAMSKSPADFKLVGEVLSAEPIAIMIRKDDTAFKKFGDEVVKELIRSGEVAKLWNKWFMQPIPPRNIKIGYAANASTQSAWVSPNDRPLEEYARK